MRATIEAPQASFGDWKKYETVSDGATVYGDHHHECDYINTTSQRKISIQFKFGRPSLTFVHESVTVKQLRELSKQFTRAECSNNSQSYLSQPYLLDRMEASHILSSVTFSTDKVTIPAQLEFTLEALSSYTQLPEEMQHDIRKVLKEQTDRQSNLMEKLSNDLLRGTQGLVHELQNNIIIYNIHEHFGVVLRWIDYLVGENRVNEAMLWCDIIPVASGESYLEKQKLALQLLTENTDLQAIVLYQNDTQVELSCQEAMFHFTYNIAKYTKSSSDEAAVINILNGLSAPNTSLTNILSAHYLVIQQARVISTLQNELEQLKKNAMRQSNNSGSIFGNWGLFGLSDDSESKTVTNTTGQDNEDNEPNMDIFAAAFALYYS